MRSVRPLGPKNCSNTLPWAIAVGAITFAVGVTGTLYFVQSQQQAQNEAMASLMMQMSDIQVSRAAPTDLLSVANPVAVATPEPQITPTPDVIPVAAAATIVPTIPSATQALARSALPPEEQQAKEIKIAIANRNQLRMLTEGVVAGLYSVTSEADDGSGDSLAYIALQSYGAINEYGRNFEANRDKLSSPDQVQIGQRLRIPNV